MATIAEKNIILRISADTKRAQKDISNVSKSVTGLSGIVRQAASTFGGLFAFQGVQAITSQISALSKQTVSLAISAEQTQVAFETFLGSASAANKILGELNQFSAVTPFEPEQVIKAGQSLLAFGVSVENIIPSVQKIGDIAAGTGTDFNELAEIFGKAKTQGRLFGEDINQLTGRGIPIIAEFAKQFNVAEDQVKGLVTQGRIGFPELEKAFSSLTGEGGKFFDLMNKQSQTVGGRISTLTGNFNELLKSIGERLLPVIGGLVDNFNQLAINAKAFVEIRPSEELAREATELQVLNLELNDANTSEARRNEIIKQINAQYPKLLSNLDQEAINLDDVTKALNEANKAFIARIALQQQEEELEATRRGAAQATRSLTANEKLLREAILETGAALELQTINGDTAAEQAEFLNNVLEGSINLNNKAVRAGQRLRFAQSLVADAQFAVTKRTNDAIEAEAFLGTLRESLADDLKLFDQIIRDTTVSEEQNTKAKVSNAGATEKQTKAQKDLNKEREKKEAADLALFAEFEIKKSLEETTAAIEKDIAARAKREKAIKDAQAARNKTRAEQRAQDEADEAEFKEAFEEERRETEKGIQEDLAIRKLAIENQILDRKKANQTFEDLNIELLEAQLQAAEIGSLDAIKIEQDLVDARRALRDQEFNEAVERARKFLDITQQVVSTTLDITKQAFEAREEVLDGQIDKQEKRVKQAVDLAEQGNAELLQAEEDRLTALRAERARNARQLQQIAAIEVAANQAIAVSQGIVAVTRAFAEGTFIEGVATSVALAATLASSVIALNQAFANVQGFAEGTEFVTGPGSSKSDSIPAMLSKGERVVPANVNAKYFDALNEFQGGTPKADLMASLMRGEVPRVKRDRVASGGGLNTRSMEKHLEGINKRLDNLQMQVNLDKDGFSASLQKFQERQERSKKLIR